MIQAVKSPRHAIAITIAAFGFLAASCSEPAAEGTPAGSEAAKAQVADAADSAAAPEAAAPAKAASTNPVVTIKTNLGSIKVELDAEKAPISVENFLAYVDSGHYAGTVFHRIIKDFMIQGGGFEPNRAQKPTRDPIKNEAQNGLKNDRGTIAMARTNVVDSATAQFFINHADNAFLNHKAPTTQGYGYAVFGRVIDGMDVVDAIANSPKSRGPGAFSDAPKTPVIIESVTRSGA